MVILGISTLKHLGRPLVTSNNGTASIVVTNETRIISWRKQREKETIASTATEEEEEEDVVETEWLRLLVLAVIITVLFDAAAGRWRVLLFLPGRVPTSSLVMQLLRMLLLLYLMMVML
mmetsp:Transcript_11331/g.26968  ORF Transcript_11331/g.26968 Transcript_11331/m.26968 type:complete len:119 (+) Transcript_11331:1405-1761(+)